LVRLGIYCRSCFRFVEHGPEAGPCPVPEWIEQCDWCVERLASAEAERERRERMWAPRLCAAPDCNVLFAPSHPKQRYCTGTCRNRTNWRLTHPNGKLTV